MKRTLLSILLSLSLAFAGLAQSVTNVGTDFWIAFPTNMGGTSADLTIFISSNYSTSGFVHSAFPGVDQSFTVAPGVVTQVPIPSGVALTGGVQNRGIRVTSVDPISVYGLSEQWATTDAFMALPVNALGKDYRVVSYETFYMGNGSSFSVVATQDGTAVTIYNHCTNSTSNVNLNTGQTYHWEDPGFSDITGSRIQSNFPVAVFGSVENASIPGGCPASDYIVEEMFPYYAWGKNYLTMPLAGRDASGDIFRIVAAEDATDITINGTLMPTINSGDYYETALLVPSLITSSKAVIVAQFAKSSNCSGGVVGDPFMMLIPPMEQFLKNYTILNVTLAEYEDTTHWVNVVAPDYALGTIYQDGTLIPNAAFSQIGTTNYYGAQRQVISGSHTFTSIFPFGLFVYGWAHTESYGYPGGCSLAPVGMVNSVTISPPTLSGILGISTLCFTAHVEDNLNNPVAGVLVTFNISGISNMIGTAYTDNSGDAQYCYARTGTTTGTDNIYAECFGHISTTSTAIWTLSPPCINPSGAGTIGISQQGCGSFTPAPLTSLTLPSGETGTLEYKWQQSITSAVAGFTDIAGSNSPDYSPGLISQTTWYRRVARVDCMTDWTGAAITEALEMTVTTPIIPTVTITATQLQVCAGTSVTFMANGLNGGGVPAYQWKVNAIDVVNANNAVFTYVPLDGDQVTCVFTSDLPCTANNPAISNAITITVTQPLPVSVSITVTANPVCEGTQVTFSANPTNQGGTPIYQWKLNDTDVGINSQFYTMTPANGDQVKCIMTSSETCSTGNPATAAPILLTTLPVPAVTFTSCFDTITTTNAKPIKLKGGIPYGGTYSGPGVTAGHFYPNLAGTGTKIISYSYTNVANCTSTSTLRIINYPLSIFNCGSPLTDIRDNKVYPTVQIGAQCWMQTNLNFGITINDVIHQTDNCIVEKYTPNSSLLTTNSFYQWDEVMRYDATPGLQGLCPPGWHIPDESEWTTLFNFFLGNSRAAYPLKDPYIDGFQAQSPGLYYLNTIWSFTDFATIFWSSTMANQTRAYSHGMNLIDQSVSLYAGLKANGFSVRCLRDY